MVFWFFAPYQIFPMVCESSHLLLIKSNADSFRQMLVGIIAENCLHVIPPESVAALRIFIAAYVFQGLGFFMTFFYICIYIQRYVLCAYMANNRH